MQPMRYALVRGVYIWDVPGLGTKKNKAGLFGERYFKKHHIRWYHWVFVITSVRIFDTDKALIRILEQTGQKFTIIRTRVDEVTVTFLEILSMNLIDFLERKQRRAKYRC